MNCIKRNFNPPAAIKPPQWTIDQVCDFLTLQNFDAKIVDKFLEEEINGAALLCLNGERILEFFGYFLHFLVFL